MTDECLPRLRVFLEVSLLSLLVVTAFALCRFTTKTEEIPSKFDVNALYDHVRPTFRRSVAATVVGLEMWGVMGLVLSMQHGCLASHWLVVLCLSLSGGCVLVGTWLGVRETLFTIECDILTMIWCLRCSCCSRLTKRALLLPPLALLVTLNVASCLESRTAEACNTSELLSPQTFFFGAASVFLAMLIATMLAIVCPLVSRRCRTGSSRLGKALVALGLATFAVISIAWAIVGSMSLVGQRNEVDLGTVYAESCWDDVEVLHAAQWSTVQLLVVGCLLLLTTFCCRLENFFLAANAPEIDMAALSPRLATIKSRFDTDDKKLSETIIAEDATVV
ncbi:hypothetical protein F442_02182 [Phytophthora nicotianae P10297]|uniref:Transmembrane protein n=1 Tax=Phytophthora nicotianae P10297 TaxID=1317064 RepID=W3A0W9_PHYNI|nr:hypothetical protein F442_02182 [Phytophthora nicotianae P10297]